MKKPTKQPRLKATAGIFPKTHIAGLLLWPVP